MYKESIFLTMIFCFFCFAGVINRSNGNSNIVDSQTENLSYVPAEILQSVLLISFGDQFGSSIAISQNDVTYIVTAKHLFPRLESNTDVNFRIFRDARWVNFRGTIWFSKEAEVDIAVIKTGDLIAFPRPFDLGMESMYLSQSCFFLGFPLGLKMDDVSRSINEGYPIPFVKMGLISAFTWENSLNKVSKIYLDGNNINGFSGGPVIIENRAGSSKNKMRVIGIVSGYLQIANPVRDSLNNPIGHFFQENTGIVVCYPFDYAMQIIKEIR